MEPTKEQIQWFWEWCGLYRGYTRDACTLEEYSAWFAPLQTPNTCMEISREIPPIDLNNLFKYAVPKLDRYRLENDWSRIEKHFAYAEIGVKEGQMWDNDPALALFWAIYKALGGKE